MPLENKSFEELESIYGPLPERQQDRGLLEDSLLGVGLGIQGAVQGTYDLLDTVTFDLLPFDEQVQRGVFGGAQTQTGVGSLVEGITQFATGFIPVFGVLGKVGRISKVARGVLPMSRNAQKFLVGTERFARTRLAPLGGGRAITAGAIADFTVFDPHEARLSNLVEENPRLRNFVTEFLASDEEDNELIGRMKGALEGVIVGAPLDLFFYGLRRIKKGRQVRDEGGSPEQVQEAMDEVELEPVESIQPDPPGTTRTPTEPERPADVIEEAAEEGDPLEGLSPEIRETIDNEFARVRKVFERRQRKGMASAVNPNRMSEFQLLVNELSDATANMANLPEVDATQLMRSAELELGKYLETRKGSDWSVEDIRTADALADSMALYDKEEAIRRLDTPEAANLRSVKEGTEAVDKLREDMYQLEFDIQTRGKLVLRRAEWILHPDRPITERTRLELFEMWDEYKDMLNARRRGRSAGGSFLGSFRRRVRDRPLVADLPSSRLAEVLQEAGGDKALRDLARNIVEVVRSNGDNVAALSKIADLDRGTSTPFTRLITQVRLEGLLSGITTHAINVGTGLMNSIMLPVERLYGGAARSIMGLGEARAQFGLNAQQVLEVITESRESLRLAAARGRREFGVEPKPGNERLGDLFAEPGKVDNPEPIGAQTLGINPETGGGRIADFIGRVLQAPSKALAIEDELVGQINFRASFKAQAKYHAMMENMTADQAAKFAERELRRHIVEGQALTKDHFYTQGLDVAEKSMKLARRSPEAREFAEKYAAALFREDWYNNARADADQARFTKPLEFDSIAKKVQEATQLHPLLKFTALPFVRTPYRIAEFVGQRVLPIRAARTMLQYRFPRAAGFLEFKTHKLAREALSNNPRVADEAMGKIMTGIGMTSVAGYFALSGKITGRGPADPNERRLWEANGFLPYALRFGNTYVSYQRLDPWGSFLGLAADLTLASVYAPQDAQDDLEAITFGLITSIANNIVNKTYAQGLADLFEAIDSPDTSGVRLFNNFVGSLVVPGAVNRARAVVDDSAREVRSVADAVLNRIPGLSDALPVRRDLLGEPIQTPQAGGAEAFPIMNFFNPIVTRQVRPTKLNEELVRLGHIFQPPPRRKNGVDLTEITNGSGQTAFDRWNELRGKVRVNGVRLKSALNRQISSSQYQLLSPVGSHLADSPRVDAINNTLRQYKSAAWQQLLREFPELQQIELERESQQLRLRQGLVRDPLDATRDRMRAAGLIQ